MNEINPDQNLIKQLDGPTIRKICSGQVIVSMAAAVKELIENALDANAKCITIRFIDYGKELIEVIDNGTGIEESNFDLLGRRHCTSKLFTFDFLNMVNTFGFRGEALNSLCNLANVKIHTRHSSQSIGTILTFDTDGRIIGKESKARDVGTTISLSQMFAPLPVRRKEFLRKTREYFRETLSLIYQYCLGMIGFKIICKNMQRDNGTDVQIFENDGITIKSNIINIFDYKQFSQLMPFVCHKDIDECESKINVDIVGFISKPDSGCGRSLSDRQYFYINERPCDLPSISKQINLIYRTYNRNQYPFVLLKINMDKKLVDFNLAPNKRKVLLADNQYLFKVIQHSMERMFSPDNNQVLSLSQSQSSLSTYLKRTLQDDNVSDNNEEHSNSNKITNFTMDLLDHHSPPLSKKHHSTSNDNSNCKNSIFNENVLVPESHQIIFENLAQTPKKKSAPLKHPFFSNFPQQSTKQSIMDKQPERIIQNQNQKYEQKTFADNENSHINVKIVSNDETLEEITEYRQSHHVIIDIDRICQLYKQIKIDVQNKKNNHNESDFQAKIVPEDNEQAEKEMKYVLMKESFSRMSVIGQFNLGFIIAKLKHDLFIIDQHAIDERYNYERFLKDPPISNQKLVCPLKLKLSTINEMILMNNLDLFKKYGFIVTIDHVSAVGQRVNVLAIPIGKEWVGGKDDIEELINAIRDSYGQHSGQLKNFIFSGLKREIAYKACRSSVMIGEMLNMIKMEQLLSQMVHVDDPWHCAHNRPTIRHLIHLDHCQN